MTQFYESDYNADLLFLWEQIMDELLHDAERVIDDEVDLNDQYTKEEREFLKKVLKKQMEDLIKSAHGRYGG